MILATNGGFCQCKEANSNTRIPNFLLATMDQVTMCCKTLCSFPARSLALQVQESIKMLIISQPIRTLTAPPSAQPGRTIQDGANQRCSGRQARAVADAVTQSNKQEEVTLVAQRQRKDVPTLTKSGLQDEQQGQTLIKHTPTREFEAKPRLSVKNENQAEKRMRRLRRGALFTSLS
jgi:hypothetical protein